MKSLTEVVIELTDTYIRKPGLSDTCYDCGYIYALHSHYGECPHPRWSEPGQPIYIEGSQFKHWGPQHDAFVTGDSRC